MLSGATIAMVNVCDGGGRSTRRLELICGCVRTVKTVLGGPFWMDCCLVGVYRGGLEAIYAVRVVEFE